MLPFVGFGAVGTVFRAYGWCVSFAILAKGDGATYLWTEALSAAVSLLLNIIGYTLLGWVGLGLAYILWYAIYAVVVDIVARRRYGLRVGGSIVALAAGVFLFCLAAASMRYFLDYLA